MRKCCYCGFETDEEMNGIYSIYGFRYYCKSEVCQQKFIEDAGEPPEDWGEDEIDNFE